MIPIDFTGFKWSLGLGAPFLFFAIWLLKKQLRHNGLARFAVSLIASLSMSPTLVAPYERLVVEPAGVILFFSFMGFGSLSGGLVFGGMPVLLISGAVYLLWSGILSKSPKAPEFRRRD